MATEIQERRQPRQFARFATPDRNRAGFVTGNLRISGELRNISLRGLYLRTKETVPVGSVGKVGVEFKNWFFRASAVVRSVEPGRGVGLQFINMNSLDQQALRSFCGVPRRAAVENTNNKN